MVIAIGVVQFFEIPVNRGYGIGQVEFDLFPVDSGAQAGAVSHRSGPVAQVVVVWIRYGAVSAAGPQGSAAR